MRTTGKLFDPGSNVLASVVIFALGIQPVVAQTMDHSTMAMPEGSPSSPAGDPAPASAQTHDPHADHAPPQSPASSRQATDHAAMGHPPASAPTAPVDHAAMGHSMPMPTGDNNAAMPAMDHAAKGHGQPAAPTEPRTPIPAVTDADRAAALAPTSAHPAHDNTIQHYVLFNRLETWDADPGTAMAWEGQGWIGTDLNRLWLRSEGERSHGHTEAADLEVLYGRSIAPWWDLVAGIRQDFKPGDSQSFAAIGVQGLAPMKFEVAATAYVGERGQTAVRLEVEYELLLTNRWVLQPLVEVNLFGKDDPARGIGSGLSSGEAGLRLRYEFTRKFAPYIGVVHERAFGRTADLRRDEFERSHDTRLVVGLRTWF